MSDISNAVALLLAAETYVPIRKATGGLRFVAIGPALPTTSTTATVSLAILEGDAIVLTGGATMSLQGQSSEGSSKQNWKFKVTNSAGKKLNVKLGTWDENNSITLKAYGPIPGNPTAFDRSMIREAVSLQLWRNIRRAHPSPRDTIAPWFLQSGSTGLYPAANLTDALFSCDCYPVELYWTTSATVAPTLLGVYMWRSSNDPTTYMMDTTNPLQYLLQADHGVDSMFTNTAEPPPYWDFVCPAAPNYDVTKRLFQWLANVAAGTDSFANHAQYINLDSWIDYVVFCFAVGSYDSMTNNLYLGSWNASANYGVWDIFAYDLDETFGVVWGSSTGIMPGGAGFPTDQCATWSAFFGYFAPQIARRYGELRDSGVLSLTALDELIDKYSGPIRPASLVADQTLYGTNGVSSYAYMRDWFDANLTYYDAVLSNVPK